MRRPVSVSLTLALTLATSLFGNAQKRAITERDLFDFHWIGDIQLSHDGHTLAFVETNVTPDHSGYETSLFLLDTTAPNASPVRLTHGPHDSSPRWSPDGSRLAFVRAAERDGHPAPAQIYLTTPDPRANPIRLSDLPKGAGSPQWSPDGQAIAVTSLTPQDQPKARLEAARIARSTGDDAHVSDVRIIDRALYRFNGEGYLDSTLVPQLYLISLPRPDGTQDAPWQLTAGRFGVEDFVWSTRPGSLFILYTSDHTDEPIFEEHPHNTLFGIAVSTAAGHPKDPPATAFTHDLKISARGLSLSPDGDHLAFHAEPFHAEPASFTSTDLMVLDLTWKNSVPAASAEPRDLTAGKGFEMGSGVGGDNTAPRGGGRAALSWSADGKTLIDVAASQGSALLLAVDTSTGALTPLTARKQAVLSFVASPDHRALVALISNPILIGDLFRIDPSLPPGGPKNGNEPPSPGNQTQLTDINHALFSQLDLQMPEELHVTPTVKPDDIPFVSIDTFVQLPPNFDKSRRYPAILNIHGGPHSAYGWVFDHEMLWMAAKGYVTIYPNPPGSTTYGQHFANVIMNNYPGNDFHDLMDSVDAVIAKGWADPAKLGVTGGSGGGLLTDWTVTQTQRFKAAVAQRDITDWANWWYTADAITFHQSFEPVAPPFDHVDLYRKLSPITYVNNIKTPMMFILGEADFRTPPTSGGEDFFRALKYKHIPTVMVRFPRESHELSRSGEPWHRIERLDNILNWFDEFLLGKCEPQYDINPTCK